MPTPPHSVSAVPHAAKPRNTAPSPRSFVDSEPQPHDAGLPPYRFNNNSNECTTENQDTIIKVGSNHAESEGDTGDQPSGHEAGEVSEQTHKFETPTPAGLWNPFNGLPLNLMHPFMAQIGSPALMMPHPQFSLPALQPQDPKPKTSKGVRAYPDKWRQVLNRAKDIVRFSVLLQEPFPRPAQACITVTECFHEAMTIECGNNMVLEPGFSWDGQMMTILLNEISTCRSELKKLAQILVASDPDMFPSPENTKKPFENLTAPEIRAAAKSSKKPTKAHQFWDPAHIHTSVEDRLAGFSFLNDPLTATGEPLTNPTFDALCQSFYEDEKWQRALAISPEGDTEWVDSVTITMVSLAATSHYHALEEWKTGQHIPKAFETEKPTRTYIQVNQHIHALLDDNQASEQIADRLRSWAEESAFIQEFIREVDEDE